VVPGLEGWEFPTVLLIEVSVISEQVAGSDPALNERASRCARMPLVAVRLRPSVVGRRSGT
jgi:hypothetical protein